MSSKRTRAGLLLALWLAPQLALAETWNPTEVAEAEKLRAAEAARATDYRARVARGEVRSAAAPMPREAPQTPGDRPAGEPLREAADIVDLLERWFGSDREQPAQPERDPQRDELRRHKRDPHRDDADAWWREERRRARGTR